jgi:hypothetical protein
MKGSAEGAMVGEIVNKFLNVLAEARTGVIRGGGPIN